MIWAMILLGLGQTSQPSVETRTSSTINLPDAIAPAVIPYLKCMVLDGAQHMEGVSTGEAARAGIQKALEACRPLRDEAETRARAMLRSSPHSAGERERM